MNPYHDSTRRRIELKVSAEARRYEEARAAVPLAPGMLVELTGDETPHAHPRDQVKPHAAAAGWGQRAYAMEDSLQGRTIEDSYGIGEPVRITQPMPGDDVLAWLGTGSAAKGAALESAGDGRLRTHTPAGEGDPPACALAVALESADATSGPVRLPVRLL